MKKILLVIVFLLILPTGGCGVAREINDTAIISGAAFDLDSSCGKLSLWMIITYSPFSAFEFDFIYSRASLICAEYVDS